MKFYITTPIYYVNDLPHIGHAYTNVAADALARFKRLLGFDVLFLTGTDEHGQKMERESLEKGIHPQEFADLVVMKFKDLWKRLEISYDDFIRTTEARHIQGVRRIFEEIYKKNEIYLGMYEGWYCTPCESYWSERELNEDGGCPSCSRRCEWLKEESYFFKMSAYKQEIARYIEENPDFIKPAIRRIEILNLIKGGLRDIAVSRSSFKWGIPVPINQTHDVIYVWFDALINYLTGCGFGIDYERFKYYWPADLHIVGKDILRFHAIIWPTMLMAAGLELPRMVFAHGWWLVEGMKMSKSLGNMIDPNEIINEIGPDAFRYFLLREVPFGMDGDFSRRNLINRINGDLANDLGNLVSRVVGMLERYTDLMVPHPDLDREDEFIKACLETPKEVTDFMDRLEFSRALICILNLVHLANEYIDRNAPWRLKRNDPKLSQILYNLAESLRFIAILISPFMPNAANKIWEYLSIEESIDRLGLSSLKRWGMIRPGTRVVKGGPLFPRINL